jgi:glycogen debranching enzyme
MADMANLTQHVDLAAGATQCARQTRESLAARYRDASQSFWISGHAATGQPAAGHRSGPPEALAMHAFSAQQRDTVLDEFASSRFQTDWGTRSMAEDSPDYDPASYSHEGEENHPTRHLFLGCLRANAAHENVRLCLLVHVDAPGRHGQ